MNTLQDQLKLEKNYKDYATDLFRMHITKELDGDRADKSPIANGIKRYYIDTLSENIDNFVTSELAVKRGVKRLYHEFIVESVKELDKENIVLLLCAFTFESCLQAILATTSYTLSSVANMIAKRVYYEIALHVYEKIIPQGRQAEIKRQLKRRLQSRYKEAFIKQAFENEGFTWLPFEKKAMLMLATQLINIFVSCTKLAEIDDGSTGSLRLYPSETFTKIWTENFNRLSMRATTDIPTIIQPKPWTSIYRGAYYGELAKHKGFIRLDRHLGNTKMVKAYLEKLDKNKNLKYIMEAVNKIQSTPYCINTELLSVVNQLIALGGDRAGIERLEPMELLPPLEGDFTKEELKQHKKLMYEQRQQERARQSRALRALKIYNSAKEFSEYERIYFPCNIDFRGRIYPMSFLNHQGDDLMKSLLIYADPVPCTRDIEDLNLLKVQGCNLYGNDKISLADRCKFIDEHQKEILASATDAFLSDFWESADEPLQFLAFCIEYKKALVYRENNGTLVGYKCSIPIAYDGTCSGLQHYSAMLRDKIGGSAVNLIDHETPADIYQNVADKVIEQLQEDVMNGTENFDVYYAESDSTINKRGTKALAESWLSFGVTRKVCKRSVMTLAYGSGQYGFGEQIYNDITKDEPHFKSYAVPASQYLAKQIWKAVQGVVVKATEGMKYLKQLANIMYQNNIPVQWVTPLGLEVEQHYLEMTKEMFKTRLGASIQIPIHYIEIDDAEEMKRCEQINGIAPNFIHSLDSTHLMMTVHESNLQNYTTIHDSFGTSLGEAYILKQVIREQFYKLYTEHDPMQEIKEHVEKLIGYPIAVEPPQKGDLDIAEVLTSTFIFH